MITFLGLMLLVDDHAIVRQVLRALLAAETDFEIAGECGDGLKAVQFVQRRPPDVMVLDLMIPGINGLEVARQVRGQTHVIILSMHANEPYVLEELNNGVQGYVLKDSTAADLAAAIRSVVAGRGYLSASISDRVIEGYIERSRAVPIDPYEALTTREREVMQLLAQGPTNNEISERLSLSPRTVEIHRANGMRKLDLHTPADVVRYAIRRGLISLEE